MGNVITFTNIRDFELDRYRPKPAREFLPDWYKETESYIGGKKKPFADGQPASTIKKCVPIFDAITSGYLIFSFADVYVDIVNGIQEYRWPGLDPISFHNPDQAALYPAYETPRVPKWNNAWAITTQKGWSCLFLPPMHRDLPFSILPGIVDTDVYNTPVNFPFVLKDPFFEGLIPAGTPIAQVIPIKKESWKLEEGSEKEVKRSLDHLHQVRATFFEGYKKLFWQPKEYR